MGEINRYTIIREAANKAREVGVTDRGEIREAVINADSAQKKGILQITEEEASQIPSVAKKDIREEDDSVKELALNKYLEVTEGLERVPLLIDAIHPVQPSKQEAGEYSEDSKIVNKLLQHFDEDTEKIAKRLAELTGSSLILAKKSRLQTDLNRAWWNRDTAPINNGDEGKTPIETFEYPRSAKAAFFWAVDDILQKQNRLDENGILKEPFVRLSIHGMKDNPDYGFAIAGSNNPADKDFLLWFRDELQTSLANEQINTLVVVAKVSDPKTSAYSGPLNLGYLRHEPGKEYLVQHPAYGDNFNSIQLEIGSKFRKVEKEREIISLALANVLKNVPKYFGNKG
jgi:hypothetical protein